ncbi:diacylglycerol kinase family protein [Robertmurraya sp. DFI.2.37]|uniref:diacylglycerol kinase family protein n=1 Tax=Robertmurraya sp. DFI.2.37 TaxID=3031819 RepID=UPI0012473C5A|nr:diacylglycerol kinase family protein [Robertmurraya sp. DFI.2.37]MDF1508317.1 diacylglycerol kinase family protein [Robertmurraya sp. DFI.2.37]
MNTDYRDKRPFKAKGVRQSFSYAFEGIKHTIMTERNMRIHMWISILVIGTGFVLKITALEWLFVLIAVGGVISLELINTALERLVDLATGDYHPLAKQAKDVAAGAVMVYALLSIIIGLIIFLPKLIG